MKKIHITVLALVLLLTVSLVFAQQPAGTKTVVSGEIATMNTPSGVIVEGEQVAVTTPLPRKTATHAQAVKHHAQMANQQASNAATQAQNAASLKKGEPKLKVNTTTTDTDSTESIGIFKTCKPEGYLCILYIKPFYIVHITCTNKRF